MQCNGTMLFPSALASACSDTIFSLAIAGGGDSSFSCFPVLHLYVGARCAGCVCQAGDDSSRYIIYYRSAPCGSYSYMQGGTNGPVYGITALDTANVYAGGKFDSAGVIKANSIAKWNGLSWDSLGSGVNGTVKAILWYNNKLYAGGYFNMAGGNSANNIAVWNGSTWSALGTGTNGTVHALTIHNGELYAGGSFTMAGGNSVNYISKWDGSQWSALSGGRNNEVYALASFQGDLYAGGNFLGGSNDTARYIARYTDTTQTSVLENNISSFSIFPNPSTGIIILASDQDISGLFIINTLGQKIIERSAKGKQVAVDITSWPVGIYFIEVKTKTGGSVRKVLKQ